MDLTGRRRSRPLFDMPDGKKHYQARKSSIDVLLSKSDFFPLASQCPSAGQFAKAFGCWHPVMHLIYPIKNAQASINAIRDSDGQRQKSDNLQRCLDGQHHSVGCTVI